MGYEALTGRLPDCRPAPLPRLGARRAGRGRPQAPGEGPREDRDRGGRDPGPRLHAEAGSDDLRLLPVPGDLPVQRRDVSRFEPGRIAAITFDFGNTLVPVGRAGLRRVVDATRPGGRRDARAVRPRRVPRGSGRRSASGSSARRCRSSARWTSRSASSGSSPGSAACRAPPVDVRWDQASAARLSTPDEIDWALDVYSRGVRRPAAAGPGGRAAPGVASRTGHATRRSSRTGRSPRRSTATSRRRAGRRSSGRSSSASGSA